MNRPYATAPMPAGQCPPTVAGDLCETDYILNQLSQLIQAFGENLCAIDGRLSQLLGPAPQEAKETDKAPEPTTSFTRITEALRMLGRQANWLEDLRKRVERI